ncbi:aminotransferase class I/II-fold pyridoxal phosphate-dependent enzyme [Epibacterium sp. SM1979]|uniref:Aminotransferase class I/II-fold pyridoxal phosphate-dependent enzyme n=1 Tax=Tritonibacter litoralis TaxID=2662264 RepID=A0A843YMA4_9RHOB|nr:PLP-dependent aminotransferase family protein [Tritonibacter litoralis]MQQ10339.1 aminotransferase class I/II-fold pyridoxal phosphate-dependent enzyme [Tritonibacter litoralis]
MAIALDTFFLKPDATGSLQAQVQELVAEGILSGRFKQGEKLPSSRKLAQHLGVSRITVTLAFTELVANDYLSSRGRSGYFVSDSAPVPPAYTPRPTRGPVKDWGQAIARDFTGGDTPRRPQNWREYQYTFIYGQADPSLFDHTNWRQCALRALGARDFAALANDQYDNDDPLLVEYIARHSLPRRGVIARPEEILITMGAQNALWLTAQVLLSSGRKATVEDPTYYTLRDQLMRTGCDLNMVPIDQDGLPPDRISANTDVIFVTPSHHSPTTVNMPHGRRQALLERAEQIDAVVVEDDYEFEMSFLRAPAPALKSLDSEGRVIYVGSFSKSLFPGLRLGYLVGPEPFIRQARALRASVLRHPPGHIQRTVAYFLSLGHYDAQIRRIAQVLHDRRTELDAAIATNGLTIAGGGLYGGSALWMQAPEQVDMAQVAADLLPKSVLIEPGAPFFAPENRRHNFYRIGYSSIESNRIGPGMALLAEVLNQRAQQ